MQLVYTPTSSHTVQYAVRRRVHIQETKYMSSGLAQGGIQYTVYSVQCTVYNKDVDRVLRFSLSFTDFHLFNKL